MLFAYRLPASLLDWLDLMKKPCTLFLKFTPYYCQSFANRLNPLNPTFECIEGIQNLST